MVISNYPSVKESVILNTKRLLLRPWEEEDREALIKLNKNTQVMHYFPHTLSTQESNILFDRLKNEFQEKNWGIWVVELKKTKSFIGFIGLREVSSSFSFAPATEILWRLDSVFWGKGYATEGAIAAMEFGFNILNLQEIVAVTTIQNRRSISVMKNLGMICSAVPFDHPDLPYSHPLRPHWLYRIQSKNWFNLCFVNHLFDTN